MMYDLALPVLVPAAGTAVLAAVYVLSKDPGRRGRAWRLLTLLSRRRRFLLLSAGPRPLPWHGGSQGAQRTPGLRTTLNAAVAAGAGDASPFAV
jgi:hypothetical protein